MNKEKFLDTSVKHWIIITEKPSVGRDYANVILDEQAKHDGYIEGYSSIFNAYVFITWTLGHLVMLSYPEKYDEALKKWRLDALPFLPTEFKYEVIDDAGIKKQFGIVKKLFNGICPDPENYDKSTLSEDKKFLLPRPDVSVIYNAGDAGREGEYIQRLIMQQTKCTKPVKRIWIDSQTKESILNGIRDAKSSSEYDDLSASAYERAIEDYLTGINFSRAFSLRYGNAMNKIYGSDHYLPFSVGRVMTCVLGLVVAREKQIRNFKEQYSYGVKAITEKFGANWKVNEKSAYFESPLLAKEDAFIKKEDAESLCATLLQTPQICVSDIRRTTEQKKAPSLFNQSELQAECAKRFKISPAETLEIAQSLYEKKLTTYPRTSARVLSSAVAKEIIQNISGLKNVTALSNYAEYAAGSSSWKTIGQDTRYTDDAKIQDHYAIIPTGDISSIGSLKPLELDVFMLIAKRFLAVFYPPAEYGKISVLLMNGSEIFTATATCLKAKGWREVEQYDEDEDKRELYNILCELQTGQRLASEFAVVEKKTEKPKRYTSGSLVLAMENAGKLIEDPELRAQIKTTGIGTDATRAETIKKLIKNEYICLNAKTQVIAPTELGEMINDVVELVEPRLLNPEFTANWEKGLAQIENGIITSDVYRSKLSNYITVTTNKIKANDQSQTVNQILNDVHVLYGGQPVSVMTYGGSEEMPGVNCPSCGGKIMITPWGFKCEKYKNGCDFTVGEICGVKINKRQLIKILSGQSSDKMKFKNKTGKSFEARLALKEENGTKKIGLIFENESKTVSLTCPSCGGKIMTTPWGFKCENYKSSCQFNIGEICGTKITEPMLEEVLKQGKSSEKYKFRSKAGKDFEAYLSLQDADNGKRVGLCFED